MTDVKKLYVLGVFIILLCSASIFFIEYLNYQKLIGNSYQYTENMNMQYYSYDGIHFEEFNEDELENIKNADSLYFKFKIKDKKNDLNFLYIEEVNTDIRLYDVNLQEKEFKNYQTYNNEIHSINGDINYFNLSNDETDEFLMVLEKEKEDAKLKKVRMITENDFEKFILNVYHIDLFYLGIGIASLIIFISITFYEVFRKTSLYIVVGIIFLTIINFITTSTFLKKSIYNGYYLWDTLAYINLILINMCLFYLISKEEKKGKAYYFSENLKNISVYVLLVAMISEIFLVQYTDLIKSYVLIFFLTSEIYLVYIYIKKNYKNIISKDNTLISKTKHYNNLFLITVTFVLNSLVCLELIGVMAINKVHFYKSMGYLIFFIVEDIALITYLYGLKIDYDTSKNTLEKINSILCKLNKQQIELHNSETINDALHTIFENANKLMDGGISGYFVLSGKEYSEKIIEAYGEFENLKDKTYNDIPEKDKYIQSKNWYKYERKEHLNIHGVLYIKYKKSLTSETEKLFNTFFSISYDTILNFILMQEMLEEEKELIVSLTEISEIRSKETGNHIKRVSEYSELLAREYGLSDSQIDTLKIASQMHDLGKLCIPDEILHKNGKLTDEEFGIIKIHTYMGYKILKECTGKYLEASKIVAKEHHEKYNGKGYIGLKGEDIDLMARIVAVADVFDALITARSYKKAWEIEKVVELFKEERGEHFDPKLVDIFIENIEEFKNIHNTYK